MTQLRTKLANIAAKFREISENWRELVEFNAIYGTRLRPAAR